MIHDEICTYEVAKLAKENGFPVKEIACWYCEYDGRPTKEIIDKQQYPIITQSLMQRWLRKNKGIIVEVLSQPTCENEQKICYWWALRMNSNGLEFDVDIQDSKTFNEYEAALEDALKYTLENLVI